MRYFIIIFIGYFFFTPLLAKELIFGVVPQQSPMELIKDWQPVITYLEQTTGEKVVLKIERSIPEFEKILYSGGYDIAYMNPYHYVVAHKRKGYIAAVRDEKNIVGILVTNKNSGLSDASMFKGKTFLFPAPDAFAATLLTKYELLKKYGIDVNKEKNYRYVNSHDSVYKGVARGIGDVGGGIERTFKNLDDKETKEALNIVYKTKSYPSHPFAFKATLSPALKVKMTNALLAIPEPLLSSLTMKHLIATDDGEFDTVRDIVVALPSTNE
ncbi:MAG: phosphate/phosphite/phosphonate ABC transporter substrate-binding protein [Sulfuricurvum sp.]|uniref:phosphate/phosphite/phosphonate ABC transporter substrate-binding protein n=1 Tax=Sulfuricurvum sp. TaxID=2025608 RepID=UPI0025EB2063|nr:phosphate/phosphite/phosphonate ABC transporter substrate-binding protein [Sulfuricurvum sp.]MBV5321272.1 phosphate/phosphite/phosphonate ABC transporter substrate-binding protein [Sulfuricurvum sp.]